MPIYEYRCRTCDNTFEELVFSTSSTVPCAACGSLEVAKLPSVFGTAGLARNVGSAASSCSGCSAGSCSGCSHA